MVKQVNKTIDFMEMRKYKESSIEIRALDDPGAESRTIQGYAVKYNLNSEIMTDYWGDKFVETFAAGAFDESLRSRDQKCLWNHETSFPLGAVRANTLRLESDSIGLYYEDEVPDNSWGNDALESIRRKDVDGSSFAFRALDDAWTLIEIDGDEVYKRTILRAELYEVSPTTFPAYPDSEVNARSFRESGGVEVNKKQVTNNDEMRKKILIAQSYL